VFETKARLAELAVLERRPDEAVALADEVLTRTEESESGATSRAVLQRVRAYALAQQGDATCMAEALRWSLDVAHEAPRRRAGLRRHAEHPGGSQPLDSHVRRLRS